MVEQIILGIAQGIAEWLPISSEGLIILIKTNFLGGTEDFQMLIHMALSLHLGTFFAALIYFWHDVKALITSLADFKKADDETCKIFIFLFISTAISGALGLLLLNSLGQLIDDFGASSKIINLIVGCFLLGTAYLELKSRKHGYREASDIKIIDAVILGITQGFAALPGLSRSGLTVSVLLLRKFNKAQSLRLSFLMSLPIVLLGNIFINARQLVINLHVLTGIFFAFIFGLATIHLLLKIAEKVNFGYFVLFFGVLMIVSTLV